MRGFVEIWVQGPGDETSRLNARFHRNSFQEAYDRAKKEQEWYQTRGYQVRFNHSYSFQLDLLDEYYSPSTSCKKCGSRSNACVCPGGPLL